LDQSKARRLTLLTTYLLGSPGESHAPKIWPNCWLMPTTSKSGFSMTQTADALILGAVVIGTAIAFEMAKAGYKTLSLDRILHIGHGSTAGSCTIVRMRYSTFDGMGLAW
jgi:hypothetical protein